MRNLLYLTLIALFFVIVAPLKSSAAMGIGIYGGLSTPNDEINNIYNTDNLNDIGKLWRDGSALGFHIGLKGRIPFGSNLMFTGGIGLNRFPQSVIEVKNPETNAIIAELKTTQNIIPISAGFNLYVLKSAIGLYGTGELTYNFISSSVDATYFGSSVPIDSSPSESRVGAGLGVGLDLNIGLVVLNLEGKYNFSNLIGKTGDEDAKNYFTLSLGVYFGDAMP